MQRTSAMTQDIIYQKRDPEEEFFVLATLALKMNHTEDYEVFEYVYQIEQDQYWKQVKEEGIPFYKWYQWLQDKFQSLRQSHFKKLEQEEREQKLHATLEKIKLQDLSDKKRLSEQKQLKLEDEEHKEAAVSITKLMVPAPHTSGDTSSSKK